MKTDRELVQWALEHGWKYFSMNRQLMNPQGGMVTVQGWDNLPDDVRSEIERQFAAHGGDSK
jgi:hypothetical protein